MADTNIDRHRRCFGGYLYVLGVIACNTLALTTAQGQVESAGVTIAPFDVTDVDGQNIRVAPTAGLNATVVCFLGTECPLARLYAPRLIALSNAFDDRGVRFVGVMSNQQDSPADIREYLELQGIGFAVGKDEGNHVADAFRAQRTPEVFVLDEQFTVRYRGRIDDQYQPGISRPAATREELREAVESVLDGRPVQRPVTTGVGCLIGRVHDVADQGADGTSAVTFSKQVSRVLNTHCVECHREGEIGPFALTDYDEIVGWADMIVEVVDQGRMPPWHANPDFGHYANERIMSDKEKQVLRDWLAAGTPFGDGGDLPESPQFVTGWRLSKQPDLIVDMAAEPFQVPDEGTVDYQYFVVDPGFTEDKWVSAAEVIAGNPAVVHHSIVFIRPPDGVDMKGIGWLTAYVPGQQSAEWPPGHARRVPAGSKFVFQQHYTPNGTQQHDLTRVGISFANDTDVTDEVFTVIAINQDFEIPPRDAAYDVFAKVRWLPPGGRLLGAAPHMHLRGKSFRLRALRGEQERVLLDVPHYDFNWQHAYQFPQPIVLDEVDELNVTVTFDNSEDNPVNPDPDQRVTWGDQTWEEMAVAFFEVAQPRNQTSRRRIAETSPIIDPAERDRQIENIVSRFFARFDRDRDGIIVEHETPFTIRLFGYWEFDENNDGKLSRDEIEQAAMKRVTDDRAGF